MYVAGRENGDSEYSQARRDKVKHEGVSKLSLVLPFKILFGGSEVIPRETVSASLRHQTLENYCTCFVRRSELKKGSGRWYISGSRVISK